MPSVCAICLEEVAEEDIPQQCSHVFHNTCITPWLEAHGTCPVCRTKLREVAATRSDVQIRSNVIVLSRRIVLSSSFIYLLSVIIVTWNPNVYDLILAITACLSMWRGGALLSITLILCMLSIVSSCDEILTCTTLITTRCILYILLFVDVLQFQYLLYQSRIAVIRPFF